MLHISVSRCSPVNLFIEESQLNTEDGSRLSSSFPAVSSVPSFHRRGYQGPVPARGHRGQMKYGWPWNTVSSQKAYVHPEAGVQRKQSSDMTLLRKGP